LHLQAQLAVGPAVLTVTDPAPFTLGAWHHVAFSADGAQIHLYKDGVEVAARDYTLDLLNTPVVQFLTVGGGVTVDPNDGTVALDPENAFFGKVDDLAIWNRSLTPDEVGKIFTAGNQGQALTTVQLDPPVTDEVELELTRSGGNITISWTGTGFRLQASDRVDTGYADVPGVTGTSFTTATTGGPRFFRLIK
jgi:hypothetical protein